MVTDPGSPSWAPCRAHGTDSCSVESEVLCPGRCSRCSVPRLSLRTDVPKLAAERTEVSLFEGGEVRLACALQGPDLGSEVFWFNNKHQVIRPDAARYRLQQGDAWFNLTIWDTEWMRDSGTYHCVAVNAVGNATVPIRLRVKSMAGQGGCSWDPYRDRGANGGLGRV